MKHIGKPCAGKPQARFDERGLATVTKIRLMGPEYAVTMSFVSTSILYPPKEGWLLEVLYHKRPLQ